MCLLWEEVACIGDERSTAAQDNLAKNVLNWNLGGYYTVVGQLYTKVELAQQTKMEAAWSLEK